MHKYQHQDKVCCVAFSPDGGMVCAGGTDWKLTIRDLTTEVVVRSVRQVGVIDVSVDGNAYAHNDWNGETVVRGLRTNEVMCYTHKKCNLGVLSPQMTYFAVKTDEHSVYIFRLKDEHGNDLPAQGQLLREHAFDATAWAKATRLAAAGAAAATAGADATAAAAAAASRRVSARRRHEIDCMSFSPDDQWIALGVCTSAVLINMATGGRPSTRRARTSRRSASTSTRSAARSAAARPRPRPSSARAPRPRAAARAAARRPAAAARPRTSPAARPGSRRRTSPPMTLEGALGAAGDDAMAHRAIVSRASSRGCASRTASSSRALCGSTTSRRRCDARREARRARLRARARVNLCVSSPSLSACFSQHRLLADLAHRVKVEEAGGAASCSSSTRRPRRRRRRRGRRLAQRSPVPGMGATKLAAAPSSAAIAPHACVPRELEDGLDNERLSDIGRTVVGARASRSGSATASRRRAPSSRRARSTASARRASRA